MNITFCSITKTKLDSDIQELKSKKIKLDRKKNKYQPITHSNMLFSLDWIISVFYGIVCCYILSIFSENTVIWKITLFAFLGIGLCSFAILMLIVLVLDGDTLGIIDILYTKVHNTIVSKISKYIDKDSIKLDSIISELEHLASIVQKVEEIYFLFISMSLDSIVDIQKENDKYKLIFSFSNPNINDIAPEGIELNENTVRYDDVLDIVIELSNDYAYNIVSKNKIDFSYLDHVYGMI